MEFIRRIGTNVAIEPNSPQRAKISKREIHSHKTISTSANDLAGVANKFGSAGDVIVRSGTNNSSDSVINGTSNAIVDDGKRAATGQEIDTETMYNLCPILLYHLATPYNGSCLEDGHLKMAHASADDHMPANENDRALGEWSRRFSSVTLVYIYLQVVEGSRLKAVIGPTALLVISIKQLCSC